MEPAAIRYKNPGAMWPGAVATKWGSKKWIYLNDGTGQGGGGHGNKIAIFDNWQDGICAQMDLWRTSPKYKNKRFADAIATWSGGNHVASYIAYVKARVPGMNENTIMDDKFWRGPMAIPFLQAQSGHEAGKRIPASDMDWINAQKRVFSNVPTVATVKKAATTSAAVVVATGGTVAATVSAGWSYAEIGLSAFIAAGAVAAVVLLVRKVRS